MAETAYGAGRTSGSRLERPLVLRDLVHNGLAASWVVPLGKRWKIYRLLGFRFEECLISAGNFIGSGDMSIGEGAYVSYGCFFDPAGGIHLGKGVMIGPRSVLITASHHIGPSPTARVVPDGSLDYFSPIHVGDHAWIGANVTILPGVTIGAGCVVAAGAVVTDDCSPHGLYRGVPAKRVRDLPTDV